MKKYKARKEREQLEAVVRPRLEIEDPSEELFSSSRPWERDDPLQDSFLEAPETPKTPKDYHRVPRLRFRCASETPAVPQLLTRSHENKSQDHISDTSQHNTDSDSHSHSSFTDGTSTPIDLSMQYDSTPEVVMKFSSTDNLVSDPPAIPERHPDHVHIKTGRSRSLPPTPSLTFAPPKASFAAFSARCAPSPTSASPMATTPVFELSADEASFSLSGIGVPESPAELEAGPIDLNALHPASANTHNKKSSEEEPEASPYNRLTALAKSIHNMNASLSTIAETEEEAASRRSSMLAAPVYELPLSPVTSKTIASFTGGINMNSRTAYYNSISKPVEHDSIPTRNISTRSSNSTLSTRSAHSVFSFEYSNSDSEKIYIAAPPRRESSAPSLTDVSSVDDFDLDIELDIELDLEARRSRSISNRDAKLERFFGIRQYSISTDSEIGLGLDTMQPHSPKTATRPPSSMPTDSPSIHRRSSSLTSLGYIHKRSPSMMTDDIDFSLALETDPVKKEILCMKRSILSKSQSKQDAKLEKFFGCDKDQIQVARKCSTGSRLAGCTDDLQFRKIGW